MAKHNELGMRGEEIARKFLEENGYVILHQNWRCLKAEVDLIAMYQKELVIVEVKTRATDYFGAPDDAVGKHKQRMLSNAADAFIQQQNLTCEVRFDIISITFAHNEPRIHHIKDAFYPYTSELGD